MDIYINGISTLSQLGALNNQLNYITGKRQLVKMNGEGILKGKKYYYGRIPRPDCVQPIYQLIIETVYTAIKNSEYSFADIAGNPKVGFIAGSSLGSSLSFNNGMVFDTEIERIVCKLPLELNIYGPKYVLSNTCCTGLDAVGSACDLIKSGVIDTCIVLAFDFVDDFIVSGINSIRELSYRTLASPFANSRDGMLLGDGIGCIILSNKCVKPNIKIGGYSVLNYGIDNIKKDLNGSTLMEAVKDSISMAHIEMSSVDVVFSCASGSRFMDEIQIRLISKLWGKSVPVTTMKHYLGHTLGASCLLEMGAVVAQMNNNIICSAAIPFTQREDYTDEIRLVASPLPMEFSTGILLSVGLSGVNGCIVLRKASL